MMSESFIASIRLAGRRYRLGCVDQASTLAFRRYAGQRLCRACQDSLNAARCQTGTDFQQLGDNRRRSRTGDRCAVYVLVMRIDQFVCIDPLLQDRVELLVGMKCQLARYSKIAVPLSQDATNRSFVAGRSL